MTPRDFLLHDHFHGTQAEIYCKDREKYLQFYHYCSVNLTTSEFNKMKLCMFLMIHEFHCFLNPRDREEFKLLYESHDFNRFSEMNDLGEAIPPKQRQRIKEYLKECIGTYFYAYSIWESLTKLKTRRNTTNSIKTRRNTL